jgi:hypothetical protein
MMPYTNIPIFSRPNLKKINILGILDGPRVPIA